MVTHQYWAGPVLLNRMLGFMLSDQANSVSHVSLLTLFNIDQLSCKIIIIIIITTTTTTLIIIIIIIIIIIKL